MAFLVVTSLMRTIEVQFLQPQPRVIIENKEQIKSLLKKLGNLLGFLDKSMMRADNCVEMKDLGEEIRKITLKAEDDIEEELLKVHQNRDDHTLETTLLRVAHDIDELIHSTESTNHHKRNVCKFWNCIPFGKSSKQETRLNSQMENLTAGGSSQGNPILEDAMVGHTKELEEVKHQLLQDSHKPLQVMAMVGMGGIGKTTFAKRIYEDPGVTSHFILRAWTTMSHEHNKAKALLDLYRCIMPMSSTINNETNGQLAGQICQSLMGRRYLIIVDDIWSEGAWDDLKRCFPDEKNGSRILLTTRNREIAKYANCGEYSRDMCLLNEAEGWNLFSHKFLDKQCPNNELETIGKNIVQKCHGLPLTIVVLAGLLSTTSKSLDDWKNIETTINSFLTSNCEEQVSRILTLSYNNLPSHLKCCFLYLGVFPNSFEVPVKKLIRLWIAEGFIGTMSHKRPEEVGWDYLHGLINRNLVMVHERSFDGKIKTCRMHDLLRVLCVRQAGNENLLYHESRGSGGYFSHSLQLGDNRWLSLRVAFPGFHVIVDSTTCRSILCFNMVVNCADDEVLQALSFRNMTNLTLEERSAAFLGFRRCEWYLKANSFKKLRVLDLSKIDFKGRTPSDISDLIFLRYLELASSKFLDHIPLRRNKNLQTLIVSEDDNGARKLPDGVWDLSQLRHLEIYHQISIDLPEVVQENLQTLYWLSTLQCTKQVLLSIPNVKELGVLAGRQESSHNLNNLCCLNHLEILTVQGSYHPLHLPPRSTDFLPNLKKLTLVKTFIPWEAITIIMLLPNLKVLKLKNYACVGQTWELIEERCFPQLKVLLISLTNLKEWKANVDSHFPALECLLLRNCFELKEMPDIGLEGSATLQLIKLEYCYNSLVKSAGKIKKGQDDIYGKEKFDLHDSNTRPDEDHVEEQTYEVQSVPHTLTSLCFEAKKLRIIWGYDPWYWNWTWDSGYEVAELLQVSWFEIQLTFNIRCLRKMTLYSAYLVFKLKAPMFQNVDTALASVRYENDDKALYDWMRGENRHSQVFLAKHRSNEDCGRFPDIRSDGWMEIKLGDFYVSTGNEGEVQLQLWHTSNQYWKSGFVVRGMEVRQNYESKNKLLNVSQCL